MWYTRAMTNDDVKEILNRVLNWPADDQTKIVRFVRELEEWRADHDVIDETGEQANNRKIETDEDMAGRLSRSWK
jgi:hypothetical protein